ncbi:winged helix-turn-helix domain-containing protein [Mesorhizobium sp. AR10]|uniref:ATP-binding protein n=1 Tax=Mesorhizobium sp. AR10 TaxID=2865839 RepID=UPI0021606A1D|nr:winged helix-turn-helix domain-containing protein [Mesorhizobium sp. AR10]UVK41065.1 winged helix-turn-helix domain-containing protein [Mesorhizobium sp. AR10]
MLDQDVSHDVIASFGPFRLSVSERLLARGGEPLGIGGRALDILIVLVEHAGEVLSSKELLRRVWPDVIVEEGSLRVHLFNLRKALGDGKDGNRYIANVAGRGYSFVAPVRISARMIPTPPSGGAGRPKRLPPRLERMIGREETVAALCSLLTERRFVNVVGPGGMGKTTVAVAIAHSLRNEFSDQIYFLDLGALGDASLVAGAVTSTLGLSGQATQDPVSALVAFLVDKPILLVLDSCEHVIDAVAALAERLFAEIPLVHLLTTSREALRVEGENVYLLTPLEGPSEESGLTAAQALAAPAVQLFMERAVAGGLGAELSDTDAPILAAICRRLDGIALAIELAAGRVGTYGIRGTVELLDDRFKLLWHGRRSAIPRHQTLQAMFDWSYNLLSPYEQTILRRLSVFVGPFALNDAIAIASDDEADAPAVADAVESLVNKSLIRMSELAGSTYHRLLDTSRVYAAAKLAETGDGAVLSRRHAHHYADRFKPDSTRATAFGIRDVSAYEPHMGNIRAALEWSFSEVGEAQNGVQLAAGAAPLFLGFSLLGECEQWCERSLSALAEADRGTERELALQAALAISSMFTRGNSDGVRRAIERGIGLAETLRDGQYKLHLLAGLNIFLTRVGDFRGALACAERSVLVAAELGEKSGIIVVEWMLGVSHHLVGNQAASQRHSERGLELEAEAGSVQVDFFGYDHRVRALIALARALWLRGMPERALRIADQAVEEATKREHPVAVCMSLVYTVPVYLWSGDFERAAQWIERVLAYATKYSLAPYHAMGLALKGELMILQGEPAEGAQLLRSAVATLSAERFNILATAFFRALAEGMMRSGQLDEATTTIDRAIALADQAGETYDRPDLLRVWAEIRLAYSPPDVSAAEDSLLQAIYWAGKQSATAWELKAAVPLARMWQQQGQADRARDLLGRLLQRFGEGVQTVDVRTASDLLAELNGTSANASR